MVTGLEAWATLCAPFGGDAGLVLHTLIESEGVALKVVAAQGWNGGCVHDRRSGERQPIVQVPSPPLTRHEIDDLHSAMVAAGLAAGVAVLTGPAHPGVLSADVYRRLARDLGENGVSIVADLSGEVLQAIVGGVRFLKVSHRELIEAGYGAGNTPAQLAAGAGHLWEGGSAANVIVSRAAEPALSSHG
jgi:1-phosphofructokinase